MKKFVWDTSALLNIKEPDSSGYSPASSLFRDLKDGWIKGPYQNIFPALSIFELQASISRKYREGARLLREFYILDERSVVYSIDKGFMRRAWPLMSEPGFSQLRGADLVFACIAKLEHAYLITKDRHFAAVEGAIEVVDLMKSIKTPEYRRLFNIGS